HYDYIVVGGGPVGLSTAHNLGKAGKKVLVLEQFMYFNQAGSSGDFVRMFRTMYSDENLCKLAIKTKDLWAELETEAQVQLIEMTGLLNFGDPDYKDGPEGNLTKPIEIMTKLGMSFRKLSREEIMKEYHFRNLPSNFIGVFAKDNGVINVFLTVRALYALAKKYGVELRENEKVTSIKCTDCGVNVMAARKNVITGEQDQKSYSAKKVIITAGAYVNDVIKSLNFQIQLSIWEMVSMYFTMDAMMNPPVQYPSMWFQFQDGCPPNLFYGFPSVSWGPQNQTRIAMDWASRIIKDPSERQTCVSEYELRVTSAWVENHCIGVQNRPVFQGTCLMANVHDNNFVLDFAPEGVLGPAHKNVIIFTAGWAFKFVPMLGKCLSQLAIDGQTEFNIDEYSINRPGILGFIISRFSFYKEVLFNRDLERDIRFYRGGIERKEDTRKYHKFLTDRDRLIGEELLRRSILKSGLSTAWLDDLMEEWEKVHTQT
ncbi:4124_t:CDS:2, partial [Paraglomus occultum]